MRGISFTLDDTQEKVRDSVDMTSKDIFLLGLRTAETAKEAKAEESKTRTMGGESAGKEE